MEHPETKTTRLSSAKVTFDSCDTIFEIVANMRNSKNSDVYWLSLEVNTMQRSNGTFNNTIDIWGFHPSELRSLASELEDLADVAEKKLKEIRVAEEAKRRINK